jgi:hypothetical protein
VIEVLADQDELVFAFVGLPLVVVEGEAFAGEVEDMALRTFVEPEDALGPEHVGGHLVVEEMLKLADAEGFVADNRERRKAING